MRDDRPCPQMLKQNMTTSLRRSRCVVACVSVCFFKQTYIPPQKLGCKFALPGNYVDLMKQAGRIRRPFQAQAFALVTLCHFLVDKFNAIGDSAVTVENVNSLEE
jgi:hypothetical protein